MYEILYKGVSFKLKKYTMVITYHSIIALPVVIPSII